MMPLDDVDRALPSLPSLDGQIFLVKASRKGGQGGAGSVPLVSLFQVEGGQLRLHAAEERL